MKIPTYARYDYCAQKACEFLEEFNIISYPIDVEKIIYQQKWGLTPYSLLMKEFNCDREKVIRCLRSKDGYTQFDGINYSIAYNDDPMLGDRKRFTLMHEIGHIYLNHLKDFDITLLYRGSLSNAENKVLENEANAFARNVLAPVSMYLTLKNKSINNISSTFGISLSAAETRKNFIHKDIELIKNLELAQKFMLVYYRFMNKQKCSVCNTQFFFKHKYCPICGSKNTLERGDGNNMKYPLLETHKNNKLKECPICGNEETYIEGEHCQICGTNLINRCTNTNYEHSDYLPTNARYCPICGYQSSFLHNGILKAWNHTKTRSISDGFLNIPDCIDEELPFN